jgi:hypothetical protein
MQLHLHSTTKIVELVVDGRLVPARIWEGRTASGVPVIAFSTRIAAKRTQDQTEFERDLQARPVMPSVEAAAFPTRMILTEP